MIHARNDYNRIQDPAGIIPENEPVFLLRAQDKLAVNLVAMWGELLLQRGGNRKLAEMAFDHALLMKDYAVKYGSKVPDMPDEALTIPCKISNASCYYHACMSDHCQKYEMLKHSNPGKGKCEGEVQELPGSPWNDLRELPDIGVEVLGFHPSWIDEDYNPDGIRVCFRDDLDWYCARWNNSHDYYVTDESDLAMPEKWMYKPARPV